MKSNKLKSNSSLCVNFFLLLWKYIKKLLFHEGKLDSLVSLLQCLCQGLREAWVLMEHLEAERSHISICCHSNVVFSNKHWKTYTCNPQPELVSKESATASATQVSAENLIPLHDKKHLDLNNWSKTVKRGECNGNIKHY